MRIAVVTDTFAPDLNGVAMSLDRFCAELMRLGHAVLLMSPVKNAGPSLADHPNFWRVRCDHVPFPGYPGLRLGVPVPKKIKKIWRDNRPDIIYMATESALGFAALKLARKLEIPVASGFHTNFHSYSKDYRLPFLEEVATNYLRKIHNECDATFAPAEDVAEKLRGLKFQRVFVLGRGVDTNLFHPGRRSEKLRSSWGAKAEDPVALYVGRIAPEKNFDLFFKACMALRERLPTLRIVVVGDGPDRKELESNHKDVIFLGAQRGEDLAACYASADLFPFASTSETYGNVVVEALASGLVVTAFNYAAPAKFLRDGENGYLAPMGDKSAFIDQVLRSGEAAFDQKIREAAVSAAADQSWARVVSGFEQRLLKIIEEYKPRGGLLEDVETPSLPSRSLEI